MKSIFIKTVIVLLTFTPTACFASPQTGGSGFGSAGGFGMGGSMNGNMSRQSSNFNFNNLNSRQGAGMLHEAKPNVNTKIPGQGQTQNTGQNVYKYMK